MEHKAGRETGWMPRLVGSWDGIEPRRPANNDGCRRVEPAPPERLDPAARRLLDELLIRLIAEGKPRLRLVRHIHEHHHYHHGLPDGDAGICPESGGICSHARALRRTPFDMTAPLVCAGDGKDAAKTDQTAVAGRIEAAPSELEAAVELWLQRLANRGKAECTIRNYRSLLRRFIRETGSRYISDLTEARVTEWMLAQKAAGTWKKNTSYNRNASAFKSLAKFLHRCRDEHGRRLLPQNTIEDIERERDDGDEGARAATLAEAREMIRIRWLREQVDGRAAKCKGALFRLCFFLAACRCGEPQRWKWKHLQLDDPVPHIHWTPDINKNRKNQRIALAPELLKLLLKHREEMRGAPVYVNRHVVRPCDSNNPEAFVFGAVPPPHLWRDDRKRLGIPAVDSRGRKFSAHSARKWAVTEMTKRGVPEKMADFLMRHKGKVEARYYDPSLEEQAEALAKLPSLWPDNHGPDQKSEVDKGGPLDTPKEGCSTTPRDTNEHSPATISEPPPPRRTIGVATSAAGRRGSTDFGSSPQLGPPLSNLPPEVGSIVISSITGVIERILTDPNLLAGVLETAVRLLRESGRASDTPPSQRTGS